MATGWLWEERYAWHDAGIWNDSAATPRNAWAQPERAFENPETKRRFRNLLDVTGMLDQLVQLRARPATDEEILRVHTPEHLAHIRALAATGGDAGDGAAMGRFGDEIAAARGRRRDRRRRRRSSTGRSTTPTRSYARRATTPSPGKAMGYCIFSNIGVAIRHAQQVRGVGRVAVVDWDVHHGNGTETFFLSDPERARHLAAPGRALPARAWPASTSSATATAEARISTSRSPPGGGNGAYAAAFERVVVPALRALPARADRRRARLRRERATTRSAA